MRLPRVQLTVRRMMVAVAVLAAAFAAWTEVIRYPWRQHLNTEITWSRSPVGEFYVKSGLKTYTANSLMKVSEIGSADAQGYYTMRRWWLGPRGELFEKEIYPHQSPRVPRCP